MSIARMRGQPLVVLTAVLAGWFGGRLATWEPDSASAPLSVATHLLSQDPQGNPVSSHSVERMQGPQTYAQPVLEQDAAYAPAGGAVASEQAALLHVLLALIERRYERHAQSFEGLRPAPTRWSQSAGHDRERPLAQGEHGGVDGFFLPARQAGFDELGLVAPAGATSLSRTRRLPLGEASTGREGLRAEAAPRRWSADAWALLRGANGEATSAGNLPASYGASQAGAILRYRLASRSPLRPTAYMRTTSSLGTVRENTAALGASVTPLAKVPIVTALEGRVTNGTGGTRLQGAALAYTQLPLIDLPLAMRAEAYAQGGYVAGAYATPFVDGQVRIDRGVVGVGRMEARLGAGVWGGAQNGAARLDAGPSAAVTMPLGKRYYGRLGVDWRFRLAGDAEPGSGPAVTLSAGF